MEEQLWIKLSELQNYNIAKYKKFRKTSYNICFEYSGTLISVFIMENIMNSPLSELS